MRFEKVINHYEMQNSLYSYFKTEFFLFLKNVPYLYITTFSNSFHNSYSCQKL